MLNKLTKEQEDLMAVVRDEWIQFCLGGDTSIDEEKARKGVEFIYRKINIPVPSKIFFEDSPMGAIKKAREMGAKIENTDWFGCGYDSGWMAFYDYFTRIGVLKHDEFNELISFIRSGIWDSLFFKEACFLIRRPEFVSKNAKGQLHNTKEKSVRFRDGWGIYSLNGITVPEWLVLTDAGQIDPMKALNEKNVDIQREIIRKIGAERMLKATNAKVLDIFIDDHENGGNEYKLMLMKVGGIERKYLYFEHASLPGVFYAQPIQPGIKKALHARAWMLGIEEPHKMSEDKIKELLPKVVS